MTEWVWVDEVSWNDGADDDDDDHLGHYYCCDEGKALCGSDLSGAGEIESGDGIDCVVCVDLSTPQSPCSPGCQRA